MGNVFVAIVLVSLIVFLVLILRIDREKDSYSHASLGALIGITFMIVVFHVWQCISPTITPMDVYQGKTTLEYKVVDGVAVDSCVVWKSK